MAKPLDDEFDAAPDLAAEFDAAPDAAPQVGAGETFVNRAANALPLGRPIVDAVSALVLNRARQPGIKLTEQAQREMAANGIEVPRGESLVDSYRDARDRRDVRTDAGSTQNPWAGRAGTGLGVALTIGAPLPGGAIAGRSLGGASKVGAGFGALQAAGDSRADLTKAFDGKPGEFAQEADKFALDTALGAGFGAGGGALGYGLAKAAPHVVRYARDALPDKGGIANLLRKYAERRAYKAAGPMLRDFRQLKEAGGLERAEDIGRELLDSNAIPIVGNVENIAERLAPLRNEAGQDVGRAISELDNLRPPNRGFEPEHIADAVERELVDPLRRRGYPGDRQRLRALLEEVEQIRAMKPGPRSFEQVEELKRSYDPAIRFDSTTPNVVRDAVRDVRGVVMRRAEQGAEALSPTAANNFRFAKRRFELLAPAEKMAGDQAFRAQANRMISPSDYIAGMAGQVKDTGTNGFLASVWALAHNQVRTRGNSFAARALDFLADTIQDPALASEVSTIVAQNPALAPVLAEAARKGGPVALSRALDLYRMGPGSQGEALPAQ